MDLSDANTVSLLVSLASAIISLMALFIAYLEVRMNSQARISLTKCRHSFSCDTKNARSQLYLSFRNKGIELCDVKVQLEFPRLDGKGVVLYHVEPEMQPLDIRLSRLPRGTTAEYCFWVTGLERWTGDFQAFDSIRVRAVVHAWGALVASIPLYSWLDRHKIDFSGSVRPLMMKWILPVAPQLFWVLDRRLPNARSQQVQWFIRSIDDARKVNTATQ